LIQGLAVEFDELLPVPEPPDNLIFPDPGFSVAQDIVV